MRSNPDGRFWMAGLMGCGKSTVGRILAQHLGCRYIDNDATIADLAGQSTVELATAGGNLLHEWESRYVRHVAAMPAPLVAGIPASAADRTADVELLARTGCLVYLRCDLGTLVRRVLEDGPRPWLDSRPEHLIGRMLEARAPVLSAAAGLITDATAPPAKVAARILSACGDS
ncbi:MAG TPA: shikimate kinase [Trebonia sp.]|nr:shikimate kinase [Trebonia sp.]